MKNKNLFKLHEQLSSSSKNYVCLVAIGSIATRDQWIEGRSDKDILVIFEKITKKDIDNLKNYINKLDFDDTYLFNPFPKEFFIKKRNNSHDFSGKFRSKILYGKDILNDVELPNKEVTIKIYKEGLTNLQIRLNVRVLNSSFWSLKKTRDTFWKLFKHAFMNLAIKIYCDKENYPKTRKEIVNIYNSKDLSFVLNILNNIDKSGKKEIIMAAEKLNNFLENLK
jgi:hypothetical protein